MTAPPSTGGSTSATPSVAPKGSIGPVSDAGGRLGQPTTGSIAGAGPLAAARSSAPTPARPSARMARADPMQPVDGRLGP